LSTRISQPILTMPKINLSPRKTPLQTRAQTMVELILEAAARVLARESLAGFNTNRVAQVAGISIGSLYQYFPNKSALMAALIERAQDGLAQSLEQLVAQLDAQSLEEALLAIAQLAVKQQYANPLLAAALDHEEKRLPLQKQLAQAENRLLDSVTTLLHSHRTELAKDLPDGAAQDCLVITKALVEAQASVGRKPPADLDRRVVRALMGYLTWRSEKSV
jgi:AcrR family transcriptional regulator